MADTKMHTVAKIYAKSLSIGHAMATLPLKPANQDQDCQRSRTWQGLNTTKMYEDYGQPGRVAEGLGFAIAATWFPYATASQTQGRIFTEIGYVPVGS